jgi:hypothetical protein
MLLVEKTSIVGLWNIRTLLMFKAAGPATNPMQHGYGKDGRIYNNAHYHCIYLSTFVINAKSYL